MGKGSYGKSDQRKAARKQSQFPTGPGHGRDAHATGDASLAGAANMRNEPNSGAPRAEREGRVNEQSQFGGRGSWAGRPCYGGRLAGGCREYAKRTQFGRSEGRAGGPDERTKPIRWARTWAGRPCHGGRLGGGRGEYAKRTQFGRSEGRAGGPGERTKPIRWAGTWAGRPCYGGRLAGGCRECAKRTQFRWFEGRAGGPGERTKPIPGAGTWAGPPCYGGRLAGGCRECAKRTQFRWFEGREGGLGERTKPIPWARTWAGRPCYGGRLAGGCRECAKRTQFGHPRAEREGRVNEQSQFGVWGHGRDAHATRPAVARYPSIPLFHHQVQGHPSIPLRCRWYEQSQALPGGRQEKRAFAVALPIPMPIIAAGLCTGGKHVSGLRVP